MRSTHQTLAAVLLAALVAAPAPAPPQGTAAARPDWRGTGVVVAILPPPSSPHATRAPVRRKPGSPLTKSFGTGLFVSQSAYACAISTTSTGSPSSGIWRGQVSVGRRDSPGSRYGAR